MQGILDHSRWGPLARAYRRQKEEAAELKRERAELEATRGNRPTLPPDFDPALWARRHELTGGTAALQRAHANELAEIERATAAELAARQARIDALQMAIAKRDPKHAFKDCLRRCGANPKFDDAG